MTESKSGTSLRETLSAYPIEPGNPGQVGPLVVSDVVLPGIFAAGETLYASYENSKAKLHGRSNIISATRIWGRDSNNYSYIRSLSKLFSVDPVSGLMTEDPSFSSNYGSGVFSLFPGVFYLDGLRFWDGVSAPQRRNYIAGMPPENATANGRVWLSRPGDGYSQPGSESTEELSLFRTHQSGYSGRLFTQPAWIAGAVPLGKATLDPLGRCLFVNAITFTAHPRIIAYKVDPFTLIPSQSDELRYEEVFQSGNGSELAIHPSGEVVLVSGTGINGTVAAISVNPMECTMQVSNTYSFSGRLGANPKLSQDGSTLYTSGTSLHFDFVSKEFSSPSGAPEFNLVSW